MDAAHAAGIAHRDLKPDNVFVLDGGAIKLIDFGLAKLTDETAAPVTRTGSVFGTPLYMSPEQCRGTAVTTRTDLYSFGVLAYHVLTGEAPFSGDPIELALHHVNDYPVAPSKRCSDLPRHVDSVVLALMAKDPADRPATLGTAIAALDGSIRLRHRRSRRARLLALGAVLATTTTVAAIQIARGHDAAAAADCAPAAERLARVWDPAVRTELEGRFAYEKPYVQTAWRATADYLDREAVKWSAQWDHACHADDRTTDPLLAAQRLTCLENQHLELRAKVAELDRQRTPEEMKMLGLFPGWGRTIDDCASTSVLRGQVPAPPPNVRPRVTELVLEAYRAYIDGSSAALERTSLDAAGAKLSTIAAELEKLDPPRAGFPLLLRAELFINVTWDVASRLPRARSALKEAIERIETGSDQVMIADVHELEASFETAQERDLARFDRAAAALAKMATATERAGRPRWQVIALDIGRGDLARVTGDHAGAATHYAAALSAITDELETVEVRNSLAKELVQLGRTDEGLDQAAERGRIIESNHLETWASTTAYLRAMLLEYTGDLAGAYTAAGESIAARQGEDDPPYRRAWGAVARTDLALRLGRVRTAGEIEEALRSIHELASMGTVPPKQSNDGPTTARRAGLFEAFAFAAEHDLASGSDAAIDNAAILAFQRGQMPRAAELGKDMAERCRAHGCADWVRQSRWFALLPVPDRAALDALDREYGGDRSAVATSAIVLAALGRWEEATPRLEAARAIPDVWERHTDLVEIDTWLALARLRKNDTAGARPLLVEATEAVAFWQNGYDGLSYMTPVAEAELSKLLATDDPTAAARHADRARRAAARLTARSAAASSSP
jgi:hypothetical protein